MFWKADPTQNVTNPIQDGGSKPLWKGGNYLAINMPLICHDSNLNIVSDHACCNGLHMHIGLSSKKSSFGSREEN